MVPGVLIQARRLKTKLLVPCRGSTEGEVYILLQVCARDCAIRAAEMFFVSILRPQCSLCYQMGGVGLGVGCLSF